MHGCMHTKSIVISHFDKCKWIDLTWDDPLSIDKAPLIIMTDRGFLHVKRQEHKRACSYLRSLSFSISFHSSFPDVVWQLLAISWLRIYLHLVLLHLLMSTYECNDENNGTNIGRCACSCTHTWTFTVIDVLWNKCMQMRCNIKINHLCCRKCQK